MRLAKLPSIQTLADGIVPNKFCFSCFMKQSVEVLVYNTPVKPVRCEDLVKPRWSDVSL
jgi:hypothetical protein